MTDLAAWLLEQIAADEQVARDAGGKVWTQTLQRYADGDELAGSIEDASGDYVVYDEGRPTAQEATHIARWDPARVLAECAAKRRLITLATEDARNADSAIEGEWGGEHDLSGDLLRGLAMAYADRPGYLEDWQP